MQGLHSRTKSGFSQGSSGDRLGTHGSVWATPWGWTINTITSAGAEEPPGTRTPSAGLHAGAALCSPLLALPPSSPGDREGGEFGCVN